jgi:hypothetical protein
MTEKTQIENTPTKEISPEKLEKYNQFRERILAFENISTLEEAKKLAKQILPVAQDINIFNVGHAQCTIVNRDDLFRISLDSDEEFLCYDFE